MRESFRPDPSLSREEMEDLQRQIAAAAVFENDFPFDTRQVSCRLSEDRQETDPESGGDTATVVGEEVDGEPPVIVGVDQAFIDDHAVSAIVALQNGEVIEQAYATVSLEIPYIPGLLSFREGGSILAAFAELDVDPDIAFFDGNGRIHFRQAGLATHIGVILDLPSVGVAKNLLCGRPTGSFTDLPTGARVSIVADDDLDAPDGTLIGYAYQSRQFDSPNRHVNPLYVSPGHRVHAETAVDLVEHCCVGYKLPEPTRLADRYADSLKADLTV